MCKKLFAKPTMRLLYPDRLQDYYHDEIRSLSNLEISRLNENTLSELENDIPEAQANRASEITFGQMWDVLDSIKKHPDLNPVDRSKYNHEDREIGFGFFWKFISGTN